VLVYLDTAHLAWLEHALLTSPPAARAFLDGWHAVGCELAVSYHHVEEIAQLETTRTRTRRLMTLWEFGRSIRYSGLGSGSVFELEIADQLRGLAGIRPPAPLHAFRARLFPASTADRIALEVTTAIPGLRRNRTFRGLSAWAGTQWKTMREYARRHGIAFPLSGKLPFTPEAAEMLVANISKLKIPHELNAVPDVIERIRRAGAGRYSQRRATEYLFALDDTRAARMAPKADLAELGTFMHIARTVAAHIDASRTPNTQPTTPLVAALDPYACRGARLRLARLRAQANTRTPDVPSDGVDADHLVYAPYVDVMFVDKRTREYLVQEARRDKGRLLPSESIRGIRQAGSLTDIERAIRHLARGSAT
jgi:hypothetical protein